MIKNNTLFLLLGFFCISLTAQKADFRYKLQDNETYRLKYYSVENSTRTMQGMTQTSETKTSMVMSVTPINQVADYFIARVKIDSMQITNNMPPMSLDSKNPGDINSQDPIQALTAIINRLCKSELVIKMDYSGKVIEFMNFDAVSQNVLQGIDQLTGQAKMIVEMQAKNLVSKGMLTGIVESTLHYLPGKEIKKGDTWENSFTMSVSGLGMITTTNYKLAGLEKDVATLEGETVIKPASDEPVNMNGAMITSQMQGMGKLNYKVDAKTGMIISGKYEYQTSGNLLVNAQGNSMEIPVESISEVTITAL
jgi:hypothetical protein